MITHRSALHITKVIIATPDFITIITLTNVTLTINPGLGLSAIKHGLDITMLVRRTS